MKRLIPLLLIPLLLATACIKDNPPERHGRVLLAYFAADNNLDPVVQRKIDSLRAGWTQNPDDHIVIYTDRLDGSARLLEYSNLADGEEPRQIAAYGDIDSANPATLAEVINDTRNAFPKARRHGLLIFSHGWGWLPGLSFENPTDWEPTRSIILDGNHTMEWPELAEAIPDHLFDYIVLEACFTAGIEAAWELRHEAPLIIGSSAEILDPGYAPIYPHATRHLFDGNLTAFGQAAIDQILTYPADSVLHSATYSIIRTDRLEALATFVRTHCDFDKAININDIQRFDRQEDARLFFDLEDYYSRLLDTDNQRAELTRLVAACVPWKAATETFMTQKPTYNGFAIEQHCGLTTYIPQAAFPGLNAAYNALNWAQATAAEHQRPRDRTCFWSSSALAAP